MMEPVWKLVYLLEPASLLLMTTAIFVVLASAQRALNHDKDMADRHRDFSEYSSITLDSSQALMIPILSSCSLLLMFYLFASVSQVVTAFTALASASALSFCLAPYVVPLNPYLCFLDPVVKHCCCGAINRSHGVLGIVSGAVVLTWLVSGHWILNNVLGISICIAFVTHVRLPNVKICTLLLLCLFVYDIFWVFFSEIFFGANVMVSVATQQAANPVHTVVNSLNLPGLQSITKKLELPVKLLFPTNILGRSTHSTEFMMLGLGDMAIPGMLLALVLCFDHRKGSREHTDIDVPFMRSRKYIWYAIIGYAIGLVAALAAGILTRSPQPALLYLVPFTLGPVSFISWSRKEFKELWNGPRPIVNEKPRLLDV